MIVGLSCGAHVGGGVQMKKIKRTAHLKTKKRPSKKRALRMMRAAMRGRKRRAAEGE